MASRLRKSRTVRVKPMTDNDTFLAYLRQVFEIAEAEAN